MRNLLVLTLFVSFLARAQLCPVGEIGVTAWIMSSAALSALTIAYGELARQHLLNNEGGSDISTHASRLLMATEVSSAMESVLLLVSVVTLWDREIWETIPATFSAIAVIVGVIGLVTSSVAFGLKEDSSDPNLKVAFGISLAKPFADVISTILALVIKDSRNRSI